MHVDNEPMVQFTQNFPFIEHGMHTLLRYYLRLVHNLHGVDFASFALHNLPHPTEAALSDHLLELEHALVIYTIRLRGTLIDFVFVVFWFCAPCSHLLLLLFINWPGFLSGWASEMGGMD